MQNIAFFAVTFRGLESVSALEISTLETVRVTDQAYRRIAGTIRGSLYPLLGLRTVDDVFLQVSEWLAIGRKRDTLRRITSLSQHLDLQSAVEACRQIRPIAGLPSFSVSANFVGKRNYSTDEIKCAVATGINQQCAWHYSGDDAAADVNIRVFIEHERALVGMRLGKRPLHDRGPNQMTRSGSLKAPIAAAMLQLAEVSAGQSVLDPCCGAGTILFEAAYLGAHSIGGDIDRATIKTAGTNKGTAESAGLYVHIAEWDAARLPLATSSVDRIVTNLPWGRQVQIGGSLQEFYHRACAEMSRVISPDGRIAVLTGTPHLVAFPLDGGNLAPIQRLEISLFGQTPTILVFRAL